MLCRLWLIKSSAIKNMAVEDKKVETPESESDTDPSAVATAPEPVEMDRKGLLGRKVGMTQVFDDDGTVVPVTVIEAGPCTVLLSRSAKRDGYDAIQVGYSDKPRRLASRSAWPSCQT